MKAAYVGKSDYQTESNLIVYVAFDTQLVHTDHGCEKILQRHVVDGSADSRGNLTYVTHVQ